MFYRVLGNKPYGVLLLVLLCAGQAQAQSIVVKDAWIRGTVQGQTATGAFMEITSKSAVRLVGVASPAAKTAEVHNMKMENGVMRMFPVTGVDIPAGQTVKLASGGYHVMLTGLQQPLKTGDKVPMKLTFEFPDKKRETIDLSVEVRDIRGQPAKQHQH